MSGRTSSFGPPRRWRRGFRESTRSASRMVASGTPRLAGSSTTSPPSSTPTPRTSWPGRSRSPRRPDGAAPMPGLRGAALLLAAPVAAALLALAVAAAVLAVAGADPVATLSDALAYGLHPETLVAVVNKAIPYYLAGIAAAVGFHLRLFNIGIDGQYRLAAFAAAIVGASVALPAPLHIALVVGVALVVGWGWAAIAGLLYVRRGVNVVISTIMLNAVATGLIAYLLAPERLGGLEPGSNNVTTPAIPESGWIAAIPTPAGDLNGLVVLAVLVGSGYWFVLNRTTLGFEVRAM